MPTPSPAPLDSSSSGKTSLNPEALRELLTQLVAGEASVEDIVAAIGDNLESNQPNRMQEISGATVDIGRQSRCGFGEVIYGEGKPPELIADIIRTQIEARQPTLVTRIDDQAAATITRQFDHCQHNPVARTLRVSGETIAPAKSIDPDSAETTTHVAVVSAGSTDAPVVAEAVETLTWMNIPYIQFDDIGVAGPQRLLAAVPRLRLASAVIVVAGMEGALPSAVSGHLAAPLFAVPTSVGYGATLGGLTPLLGMLSSCAAGVAVVNIDAGFKGGYLAGLVIKQLQNA